MQAIGTLLSQPSPDNDSQPYTQGIPSAWLEAVGTIFERFAMHYGAARMNAHWAGVNAELHLFAIFFVGFLSRCKFAA